jgi:hypothetical protein
MRGRRWMAALLTVLPLSSTLAGPVNAVETGGRGTLTKCPSLFPTHFCHTYRHVGLPVRIAVGDTLRLDFGSNPKEFAFPVARIALEHGGCTIFSETGDDPDQDKLTVASCRAATETGGSGRNQSSSRSP